MNILLWVLQVLAALLYGSSGVMKVFMFDKVSKDVPSIDALPRGRAHDLERRAGPLHGVHCVWSYDSDADLLTGGRFAILTAGPELIFISRSVACR
jgi:hypothetical protein